VSFTPQIRRPPLWAHLDAPLPEAKSTKLPSVVPVVFSKRPSAGSPVPARRFFRAKYKSTPRPTPVRHHRSTVAKGWRERQREGEAADPVGRAAVPWRRSSPTLHLETLKRSPEGQIRRHAGSAGAPSRGEAPSSDSPRRRRRRPWPQPRCASLVTPPLNPGLRSRRPWPHPRCTSSLSFDPLRRIQPREGSRHRLLARPRLRHGRASSIRPKGGDHGAGGSQLPPSPPQAEGR
jgi:hypothetical protein